MPTETEWEWAQSHFQTRNTQVQQHWTLDILMKIRAEVEEVAQLLPNSGDCLTNWQRIRMVLGLVRRLSERGTSRKKDQV